MSPSRAGRTALVAGSRTVQPSSAGARDDGGDVGGFELAQRVGAGAPGVRVAPSTVTAGRPARPVRAASAAPGTPAASPGSSTISRPKTWLTHSRTARRVRKFVTSSTRLARGPRGRRGTCGCRRGGTGRSTAWGRRRRTARRAGSPHRSTPSAAGVGAVAGDAGRRSRPGSGRCPGTRRAAAAGSARRKSRADAAPGRARSRSRARTSRSWNSSSPVGAAGGGGVAREALRQRRRPGGCTRSGRVAHGVARRAAAHAVPSAPALVQRRQLACCRPLPTLNDGFRCEQLERLGLVGALRGASA